jgi:hypothetical protein
MTAFSFPTNPTLAQEYQAPDGGPLYIWNGYAWIAQSAAAAIDSLEARVVQLETDIVNKIGQGDDATLNSVRSLTRVTADGEIIAYFEIGRDYTASASMVFMDCTATATLLDQSTRANYEGTFYFGDPREGVPAIPPVMGEDGVTEITPGVPEVPAYPGGVVHTTNLVATYQYTVPGTYTVRFDPDNAESTEATTEITAIARTGYTISPSVRFDLCNLSVSPAMSGVYDMGDGIAEQAAVNKNRITATPDPTPVPYMYTFAIEGGAAGTWTYGNVEATTDATGVFTYVGPGTYAVTFTDGTSGIVSNLSLVVADGDTVAQTGAIEEISPYVPPVPTHTVTSDASGNATYNYPRAGDFTITFTPDDGNYGVTAAVNIIMPTLYTMTISRSEMTGTFTMSPALPGTYYFGDGVAEIPEVPAVYKKHITATPLYDPAPLTFTFDTGVPGLYAFGDVEATTNDSPNGVSQMTYTAAGTYTVTFTETSTAAVSTLSLVVPDVDPVAQTSPDEILTDVIPAVPAIPEGTLVSADGTGSYVYPREGTYTVRYAPDDGNDNPTGTCIAHISIPYVISSPEYFLYKTLSLSPTCGGQYRMGDAVAEVVGVYKAHIIATPDATLGADGVTPEPVPYKFTFTNDGVTAFSRSVVKVGSRSIRQLNAKKSGRSAGSYSYGDPAGTVDTAGVFTYPAAGTYTVTFTDDATGAVSTLALNVLDTGNIQQVSDNDWYVVPAPAIPEGIVATTDGIAEYTYPRPGDYTITFEPNELSKPVTLAVTAPARTTYSITASRDDRIATLASSPALPGTYYFGDPVPEIPGTPYQPPVLGEDGVTIITPEVPEVPAVPAVPEGSLISTDGTGTYTYAVDGTFTIRYVPDDHNYEATVGFISHASIPYVITPTPTFLNVYFGLDIPCGGVYDFGDSVAEVPPVLDVDGVTVITPGVPAIPAGTATTIDGTAYYTYREPGTYTVTFTPNELSKPVTTTVTVNSDSRVAVNMTVATSQSDFVLSANLPAEYVAGNSIVNVIINADVVLTGSSTSAYGFQLGDTFIAGDTIIISNNGTIVGSAGARGVGQPPSPGGDGGTAMYMNSTAARWIVNNSGSIVGGGGGGAGGGGSGHDFTAPPGGIGGVGLLAVDAGTFNNLGTLAGGGGGGGATGSGGDGSGGGGGGGAGYGNPGANGTNTISAPDNAVAGGLLTGGAGGDSTNWGKAGDGGAAGVEGGAGGAGGPGGAGGAASSGPVTVTRTSRSRILGKRVK